VKKNSCARVCFPGNQELVAKSDVISAVNSIVPAVNVRDEALAREHPTYMTVRGKACLLLAACLEGREDDATHRQLDRRLETHGLAHFQRCGSARGCRPGSGT